MVIRLGVAAMLAILACTPGQKARADIFTWVDASGTINVSNLAPPNGVSATKVIHENATPPASDDVAHNAAREAQLQALTARIGQLEDAIEYAQRPAAPPVLYPMLPPPAPTFVSYTTEVVQPPLQQYAEDTAPSTAGGCDPSWAGCVLWWIPSFYPLSVIGLRAPPFGHPRPPHGGHDFAIHPSFRSGTSLRKG